MYHCSRPSAVHSTGRFLNKVGGFLSTGVKDLRKTYKDGVPPQKSVVRRNSFYTNVFYSYNVTANTCFVILLGSENVNLLGVCL